MKRTKSTGYFVLAGAFLLVAVIWFLWMDDLMIAAVALALAVVEFVLALSLRKKEKNPDQK